MKKLLVLMLACVIAVMPACSSANKEILSPAASAEAAVKSSSSSSEGSASSDRSSDNSSSDDSALSDSSSAKSGQKKTDSTNDKSNSTQDKSTITQTKSGTAASAATTPTPTPTEPAPQYTEDQLIILQDPSMYTYADMMQDTNIITSLYAGFVTKDSLGTTADGRELVHFVVGNPNATKQIFINGAIHAREYLTAQLVMKQMVTYIQHVKNGDYYGDVSYADMWNNVAIHVVPMVNPDGVSISQLGLDGVQTPEILNNLYNIAALDGTDLNSSYLDTWKANALGVDLNRNFDAYWEYYQDPVGHVSSDHYKGEYPGSEIESAALINLTNNNNFLYTISYHTQGQLIYWCFDNMDAIYDTSYAWVSQLSAATGYPLDSNYEVIDPAGYSDWGIYRCQIPSVTIEVASGVSPYLSDQFGQVWNENLTVWEITILCALGR